MGSIVDYFDPREDLERSHINEAEFKGLLTGGLGWKRGNPESGVVGGLCEVLRDSLV